MTVFIRKLMKLKYFSSNNNSNNLIHTCLTQLRLISFQACKVIKNSEAIKKKS